MTDTPRRVRLSRAKGWRIPANTVKVDRSTKWGNPFIVGAASGIFDGQGGRPLGMRDQVEILVPSLSLEQAIDFYRDMVQGFITPEMYPHGHDWTRRFHERMRGHPAEMVRCYLRGKNLACWCALDQPCHADVLLEIASSPDW